jgi:hypothetical protein
VVKPEAVNALKTPHVEVCVKNDVALVPADVIATVTVLPVHEFARIEVAVVKVSTGLVADVPETRLAKGMDSPTRETCPITVDTAVLTAQDTVSLLVETLMPLTESRTATPAPIVKPQIVAE